MGRSGAGRSDWLLSVTIRWGYRSENELFWLDRQKILLIVTVLPLGHKLDLCQNAIDTPL